MQSAYTILFVLLSIASVYDVTQKKIPNWISLLIIFTAFSLNCFTQQGAGIVASIAGFFLGLVLMLPSYIYGGMGAGDVKLMAAIGSFVGYNAALEVVLYSYLLMFVMAVALISIHEGWVKLALRYKVFVIGLFSGVFAYQKPEATEPANYRLPLAPAISMATFYVLLPKICNFQVFAHVCRF